MVASKNTYVLGVDVSVLMTLCGLRNWMWTGFV